MIGEPRGDYPSTIHLRAAEEKQNGFTSISEREILSMSEEAVPKNTKMAMKYLMVSYLISAASYYKAKDQNTMPCLRKLSSTKITMKTMKHLMFFSLVSTTRGIQLSH